MPSKNRMLIAITLLIAGGFLTTSLLSFFVSRQHSIDSLSVSELPLTSNTIYSEVQHDLIAPQIVSSVMANDTFVRDWIIQGENNELQIISYLSEIVEKYDAFTAFLAVDESSNYYAQTGFIRKISEQNTLDEWYYRIKENEELIELNVDPAEVNNDQLTLFFNARMVDENDEFLAAIGIGLNRDLLNSKLEKYRQKYGHRVHFVTPEGKIFLHENSEYEGKDIKDLPSLSNIANELLRIENGQIEYRDQGRKILVHTRYIKDIDLILLVEADVGAVTEELYEALFLNIFTCIVITLIVLFILLKAIKGYQKRLESIASRDGLTGLYNRQAFNDYYQKVQSLANSSSEPNESLCLLLLDIDYFKQINDQHGHVIGDEVLICFSKLLTSLMPDNSFLARWGGEEFVLLLAETSLDETYEFAEKIRKLIEKNEDLKALLGNYMTVSIGMAKCNFELSQAENFQKADKLMYRAKEEGRNRSLS